MYIPIAYNKESEKINLKKYINVYTYTQLVIKTVNITYTAHTYRR